MINQTLVVYDPNAHYRCVTVENFDIEQIPEKWDRVYRIMEK
jgi:hypothetical protein